MRKILFNYADRGFYKSQEGNAQSGLEVGNFDLVYKFRFSDMDSEFVEQNKDMLSVPTGAGLWLWKYYFAIKMLNDPEIKEDDILFYSDSGATFIHSIDPMVEAFLRDDLSVMTFLQLHPSKNLTKRDVFILTGCDEPKYRDTGQRVGGFWMFRKNETSIKFFTEMLHYAQMPEIMDGSPSKFESEWSCFRCPSHDEGLISVIAKKYDFYAYRNPTQYGFDEIINATFNEYTPESYQRWITTGGQDRNRFIGAWMYPYGSFEQYPPIVIDDKSTYPTILRLHRGTEYGER